MNLEDKKALLRKALKGNASGGEELDPYALFERYADVNHFAEVKQLDEQFKQAEVAGLQVPYFLPSEGSVRDTARIKGQDYISFSGYNYLGLAGDSRVDAFAIESIRQYGTTVSASRIAAGERPLHQELEGALARFMDCEAALTFVSGHGAFLAVIGHLMGPADLIVYDEFAHNCIMGGMILSGARRMSFKHNDPIDCDRILREHRKGAERVLIAVEGVYSMDGDVARLDEFVELKRKYRTLLLVDEAHSIGVMGASGRGIGELQSIPRDSVDLWMGTFSKAFASCGGYVAGQRSLIQFLRYTTPGFIFSVGISPANAAAALKSLELIEQEPERIVQLHENASYFLKCVLNAGFSVGLSAETPIVPLIVGNSLHALKLAQNLFENGISVHPILPPAVAEDAARLRFFITSCHSREQLDCCIEHLLRFKDSS